MTKIQTNRVALICRAFVLIFLCVCFMGNANVFGSCSSSEGKSINITFDPSDHNEGSENRDDENASNENGQGTSSKNIPDKRPNQQHRNIEIVNIDIDCQDVKDISAPERQYCIDTINALKRIARTDELDALDHVISNTDTSKNVVKQIQEHYKEIKKAARETKQDEELQEQLKDAHLTREDYLQILDILEEIIKLNGVYVTHNTDNNRNGCILMPASQCILKKFIELVIVRKYVKVLQEKNGLKKENRFIHTRQTQKIHNIYCKKTENDLYKYKNTPNADIIKNVFTSNNNADANTTHNAIRSLTVHHIFPKSLLGPSIFANYVILTQVNHTLVHVSKAYKKLDQQNAADKLNGIKETIKSIAQEIAYKINNDQMTQQILDQLYNKFYRHMVAITLAQHNTDINIKYKLDGIPDTLKINKH